MLEVSISGGRGVVAPNSDLENIRDDMYAFHCTSPSEAKSGDVEYISNIAKKWLFKNFGLRCAVMGRKFLKSKIYFSIGMMNAGGMFSSIYEVYLRLKRGFYDKLFAKFRKQVLKTINEAQDFVRLPNWRELVQARVYVKNSGKQLS